MLYQLRPTPKQAPCPPHPCKQLFLPLEGRDWGTVDHHYPSNFTGGVLLSWCVGVRVFTLPTMETTDCSLFLETLTELIRFQECVSEWNKISLSRYYCKNALGSFSVLKGLDLTPWENKTKQEPTKIQLPNTRVFGGSWVKVIDYHFGVIESSAIKQISLSLT